MLSVGKRKVVVGECGRSTRAPSVAQTAAGGAFDVGDRQRTAQGPHPAAESRKFRPGAPTEE